METKTNQGTPQTTGQSSDVTTGSTPAKTLTEAEYKVAIAKARSDALAEAGRKYKSEIEKLTSERDSLSTTVSEVASLKQQITDLTAEIDELSKDDPDKQELVKLRKEVKAKLSNLTAKETVLNEREAKVQQRERDELVFTVADDFLKANGEPLMPADFDAFKTAADKFKLSDRAGLEALAEEKGWKLKTGEPEGDSAPLVSGKTNGGNDSLANLSPKDRAREADRRLRAGTK